MTTRHWLRANNSRMGLSAYAFTVVTRSCATRGCKTLKSGMVGINSFALAASEAPFRRHELLGIGPRRRQ